ncbi:unnamed protein product, partial [Prorocentrum cordatum]
MCQVARDRKLGRFLAKGRLRHVDVCHMILATFGASGDDAPGLSVRRFARQFRSYLSEHPELGDSYDSTTVSLSILPQVVKHWCRVDIRESDVAGLATELSPKPPCAPDGPAPMGRRRAVRKANALATLAPLPDMFGAAVPDAGAEHGELPTPLADVHTYSQMVSVVPQPADSVVPLELLRYAEYTHVDLQMMLSRRDRELEAMKAECADLQRSRAYDMNRTQEWLQVTKDMTHEYHRLRDQLDFRPGAKNMSPFGGYTIALGRNAGHASASSALAMLAGSEDRGGFRSYNSVVRYEHRAALGQKILLKICYDEFQASADMEVHCFKFDATNSEALEKTKIHTQLLTSWACRSESLPAAGTASTFESFAPVISSASSCPDLQTVHFGTGAETYMLGLKGLYSVGCPDWEQRATEAETDQRRFSVCVFGTDAGPDNVAMGGVVRARLARVNTVAFTMTFCFLHQCHLAVLTMLSILDAFAWLTPVGAGSQEEACGPAGLCGLNTKYFAAVATVANAWRGPGVSKRMRAAARSLYTAQVANDYFGRVPGRAMRGRWGAIDAVEALIVAGAPFIGPVFAEVFPPAADAKKPSVKVGSAEDVQYREEQKKYKRNAVGFTGSSLFHVVVLISSVAKQPLTHFLHWVQKATKDYNDAVREARAADQRAPYLGPTPLSQLTTGKAADIAEEISNLLASATEKDHHYWGSLWGKLQTPRLQQQARSLIVHLVLAEACSWKHRVIGRLGGFPYQLFHLVREGANKPCDHRNRVAALLLASNECCLTLPFDDFTLKLKRNFEAELRVFADMHRQIMAEAKKAEHSDMVRFDAVDVRNAPTIAQPALCPHQTPRDLASRLAYALDGYKQINTSATHVVSWGPGAAVAFLAPWSYGRCLWTAACDVMTVAGLRSFKLRIPLEVQPLHEALRFAPATAAPADGGRRKRCPVITVTEEEIIWKTLDLAQEADAPLKTIILSSEGELGESDEDADYDAEVVAELYGELNADADDEADGDAAATAVDPGGHELEHATDHLLDEQGHEDLRCEDPAGDADDDSAADAQDEGATDVENPSGSVLPQVDMATLRERHALAVRSVQEAQRLQRDQTEDMHPLLPGVISLVRMRETDEVIFVRWAKDVGVCRPLALDARGGIIYIIGYVVPTMQMTDMPHDVLIRDTGAIMLKVRAHERPRMPEWCLTVQKYYRATIHPGPQQPGAMECSWCLSSVPPEGVRGAGGDMMVCATCLLPWHL